MKYIYIADIGATESLTEKAMRYSLADPKTRIYETSTKNNTTQYNYTKSNRILILLHMLTLLPLHPYLLHDRFEHPPFGTAGMHEDTRYVMRRRHRVCTTTAQPQPVA